MLLILTGFFLVLPLFKPRGIFGWGHYRLIDVYAGIPILLCSICLAIFLVGPASGRVKRTARFAAIFISILFTVGAVDIAYAFGVHGAWRSSVPTDVWFDGESITRDNAVPDSELGFVRKPFVEWEGRLSPEAQLVRYRTDEIGFRNAPGTKQADIVFIGDSFTEGASVAEEKTFVQRVAAEAKVATVNLGRGHYGPQQELIVLKRYGQNYNPRIVVWQIFEGNDLADARNFAGWRERPPTESLMLRYTKRSLIAGLLNLTKPNGLDSSRPLKLHDGNTTKVHLDYRYLPDEPAREPRGLSELTNAIAEGNKWCQSHGIKLLVVFIPIKVRVLAPYVQFKDAADREEYLPDGKSDTESDFAHALGDFCQSSGCPFIDMTDYLRQGATEDNRSIYALNRDSHLDEGGHAVVARVIGEWVRNN